MTETESKWLERVRDWRASGKTAAEYAAGRDFKASTLRYRASVLGRRTPSEIATPGPPAGVRMARVVRRPTADATIEVAVGGARVVVRGGFDGALLRQVVQALGGGA